MGIIKVSKTQRGDNNYIFECQCGCNMLRLCKNSFDDVDNPIHSFEIWEYRGETNWNIWKRISLAFRILIGKEAKFATSEVLFENDDVEPLANAILSLKKSA
jgi:hypothetical protein